MLVSKLAVPNTWHSVMPIAFFDGSNWKRNRQHSVDRKLGKYSFSYSYFVEAQCLYFVIKDNWILWYALNCIIIPCKLVNKLPSRWVNVLERTNKLANQRLTNERFKVFRAKITEKPNKLENTNYKTCHVLFSNSTSKWRKQSTRTAAHCI